MKPLCASVFFQIRTCGICRCQWLSLKADAGCNRYKNDAHRPPPCSTMPKWLCARPLHANLKLQATVCWVLFLVDFATYTHPYSSRLITHFWNQFLRKELVILTWRARSVNSVRWDEWTTIEFSNVIEKIIANATAQNISTNSTFLLLWKPSSYELVTGNLVLAAFTNRCSSALSFTVIHQSPMWL